MLARREFQLAMQMQGQAQQMALQQGQPGQALQGPALMTQYSQQLQVGAHAVSQPAAWVALARVCTQDALQPAPAGGCMALLQPVQVTHVVLALCGCSCPGTDALLHIPVDRRQSVRCSNLEVTCSN